MLTRRASAAIAVLAGTLAVVVVYVFAKADHVLAPAIAIAGLVVVGELLIDRERRRADDAERLASILARQAQRGAPAATPIPAPLADDRATVDQPVETNRVRTGTPVAMRNFRTADRRRDDAQCPSCGRFSVDTAFHEQASSYRCRTCGMEWSLHQNEPWPDVRVVADLRKLEGAS